MNFQTVADQVDKTYDVEYALLEVERLEKEIVALMHPEDYDFALNPTIKAITREDEAFWEEIELSGSASVKIPLGLSDAEMEKYNFSINSLSYGFIIQRINILQEINYILRLRWFLET